MWREKGGNVKASRLIFFLLQASELSAGVYGGWVDWWAVQGCSEAGWSWPGLWLLCADTTTQRQGLGGQYAPCLVCLFHFDDTSVFI